MPDDPTLDQVLREVIEASLDETLTSVPGSVQSWDSATETADIVPLVKRPDGASYPVIRSAKVVFPGAYWDLSSGETGVVFFGQWDFSRWWRTGTTGTPEQLGRHTISSAVFLPGLRRKATARGVPSGATVLAGDDVRLGVDSATEAVIRGDAYTGHESTFLTALAAWVAGVETALGVAGSPIITPAPGVFVTEVNAFKGQLSGDLSTKVSVD